jgi:hypothetical protein
MSVVRSIKAGINTMPVTVLRRDIAMEIQIRTNDEGRGQQELVFSTFCTNWEEEAVLLDNLVSKIAAYPHEGYYTCRIDNIHPVQRDRLVELLREKEWEGKYSLGYIFPDVTPAEAGEFYFNFKV